MTRIAQVTEPHVDVPDVARLLREAKASGQISGEELVSLSVSMSVAATGLLPSSRPP